MGFELYPCRMGFYHDFAVGYDFAICNKCGTVATLREGETAIMHTDNTEATSIKIYDDDTEIANIDVK
jgi:hypothetical protein